jgi:bifunctional NMN adenylyltransferase/nudix hydrolase
MTNIGVFIGRFQPFHLGHYSILIDMLKENDKVIVVVGSSYRPRDIKNIFTQIERINMINSAIPADYLEKNIFIAVMDYPFDDKEWANTVKSEVEAQIKSCFNVNKISNDDFNILLYGHYKDSSSFYLNLFNWTIKECQNFYNINATDIRELMFSKEKGDIEECGCLIEHKVNDSIYKQLKCWEKTNEFKELAEEYEFIRKYKESWSNSPYPPIFVTVDAVIECLDKVLLIKRKRIPGKNLWALPGGFINEKEKLIDACIRELKEETKIKLNNKFLLASLKSTMVVDTPNRSLRGRIISHVFHFSLPLGELPEVKGSDDALEAKWISKEDLKKMSSEFFEDHLDIISEIIKIKKEKKPIGFF